MLDRTAGRVVGAKQTARVVREGRAKCVYLARDASEKVTEPIRALAGERQVPIRWFPSMAELGSACSIDVGSAAAAELQEPQ